MNGKIASGDTTQLRRRLREAGAAELSALLEQHSIELDVDAARQAMRNPFITPEGIGLLLESRSLRESPEMRREFTLHPRTPLTQALRLVPGLRWRALAELGADTRVHPQVRRAADLDLVRRLPGLALGERIALARVAGQGVIQKLCHDSHPRVMTALLENPRLTEGALAPALSRESTSPEILRLIADSSRWGIRPSVRLALCRNPRTPVGTVLGLLPMLRPSDLRQLAQERRLAPAVRGAVERILGRDRGGSRRRRGGATGGWQ